MKYRKLILALILIGIYIGIPSNTYILNKRVISTVGMLLISALAIQSVFFTHKLSRTTILAPSVLGMERFVLCIQIVLVILGVESSSLTIIISSVILLVIYKKFIAKRTQETTEILLVGMVIGLFFKSVGEVLQSIMDPNLFQSTMNLQWASLSKLNWISIGILLGVNVILYYLYIKNKRTFDIYALQDNLGNSLGIDMKKVQTLLLFMIGISSSLLTLIVGPIGFLGLLGINITYKMKPTNTIYLGTYVTFILFIVAQFVFERLFNLEGSVFIFINCLGGIYLLYILLKNQEVV